MSFETHRKIILVGIVAVLCVCGACSSHEHAGTAAHTMQHTTPADHEARQISGHKAHSASVARAHAQRNREAAKARKALAYACRPIPGYPVIVTGSTVAEGEHNRAMTLAKIRQEQAWDDDHAQGEPGDGIPGDDDTSQDPRINAHPNGHGNTGDPNDPEFLYRKHYFEKHPPHRATSCPSGQHPVGQTGACA